MSLCPLPYCNPTLFVPTRLVLASHDLWLDKDKYYTVQAGPECSFSIEDTTQSLAAIPLPFSHDEGYLSDWPEELCEYAVRWGGDYGLSVFAKVPRNLSNDP